MHRQLAVLTVLLSSAFALPPMRRDGAYPSVVVENNVNVNVHGAPSGAAPVPSPSRASYGGIDIGVNVDNSISYGGDNIDVDTHVEIDVNGNECEVNSSGVTVKTKINGVWYDTNSLPSSQSYIPSPSAAPYPPQAPASYQPVPKPWTQGGPASQPPARYPPSPASRSSTTTTSSSTTPNVYTTPYSPPTNIPSTPYFISGEGVMGISWDPFTGTDQSCKSESQITADIKQLVSYGYQNIRLYGVECNAIDYALSAVSGTGTNLIIGIYTVSNYTAECADMISQVNGRWDLVEYVSVFNEAVNDGTATVSDVETTITYVKSQIPDNTVPVTTIDTFSAFIAHPDLCDVGADFIACNCQPYFSAVSASDAGAYVKTQREHVAKVCNVNSVDITESGWPAAGQTLGAAICSPENQYIAVQSIISALNGSVVVFEAFDDTWKAPGPNGVEKNFVWHYFDSANHWDCTRLAISSRYGPEPMFTFLQGISMAGN